MGGKVPQFEGEGTLKEYPDEYTKIFPMTRGGLAAAGQQCDDESKCDTSACPDGTNDCWKLASSASLPDGPLPFIYIDMLDPGTYPSLAVWWQLVAGNVPGQRLHLDPELAGPHRAPGPARPDQRRGRGRRRRQCHVPSAPSGQRYRRPVNIGGSLASLDAPLLCLTHCTHVH